MLHKPAPKRKIEISSCGFRLATDFIVLHTAAIVDAWGLVPKVSDSGFWAYGCVVLRV